MSETVVVLAMFALVLALVMIATGQVGLRSRHLRQIQRRQAELDAKLDAVLDHLGIALPAPEYPDVERFLAEGSVVRAVKAYRDATGAELKEAKDAVDEIARRRGLSV
jgi:hypothetical protein